MENSLTIFTRAAAMLAEADTIQKARELKDLALTAAEWARRKGMGEEAILHCKSYAFEAERKMGEMLAVTKKAKGTRMAGTTDGLGGYITEPPSDVPTTLADLGLTKRDSAEAQQLAAMPQEIFEAVKDGKKTRSAAVREMRVSKNGQKLRSNKAPKEHSAAPEVIDLRDKGLTNPEIAKQTGIHPRMVRKIVEHENLRRSGEPQITPDMLSMSAQQKLDTAIEQHRKKLAREFDAAVHAEARKYLERVSPSLLKREHLADRIIRMREGFMTRATYVLILSCLHPDWVTDDKQKSRYANAFREFTKLEKLLLDEKESPTDIPRMPTTAAEWQEAKRQATEARKAKRQKSDLARR